MCPTISVVVAEGSAKAMKKFNALMMRRIAWDARQEDAEDEAPADRYTSIGLYGMCVIAHRVGAVAALQPAWHWRVFVHAHTGAALCVTACEPLQ